MKIVSFNVNGVRARLHQLSRVIDDHSPDLIGLQEIKVSDEHFPVKAIEDLGYSVLYHGQKTHYGVALLSKTPAVNIQKGFPTDLPDAQRRVIIGDYELNGQMLRVINGYFPQGENRSHETKFADKARFYNDLQTYLQNSCSPSSNILVIGDFNISHTDLDIGIGPANARRWLRTGKCSFLPEEREWFDRLLEWGLTDCFRELYPDEDNLFSWFDYRSRGFESEPKRGLRIDSILATNSLMQICQSIFMDYKIRAMEKPSDHAPVIAEFSELI
ncbi:exodeoxyribonuclease III [Endozoicomonas acroporae]|uniref:exodeoxyribonuclease III n=1 Tax=Endozoicomonas acroporae TaxID=1701104 RepID=UPI0013D8352B|nr:exodeoxyribonuclease III [Endozoicomonas acroporae]